MAIRGVLWAALALPLLGMSAGAQPSGDERARPMHFEAMDADGDGMVSRSEWLTWFLGDMHGPQSQRSGTAVVISDGKGGMRTLTARPMSGGVAVLDSHPSFGDDRIANPIAARNRMLSDQRAGRAFPQFEAYDTNGDQLLSREELHPLLPPLGNPIPPR